MYAACAVILSSMLGGWHDALVPASGLNSNCPFEGSADGVAFHDPFARLQFRRMLTVPSAPSRMV